MTGRPPTIAEAPTFQQSGLPAPRRWLRHFAPSAIHRGWSLLGIALACAVVMVCPTARAAMYTYTVNSTIPDNNIIGLTDSHVISGESPVLTDIRLTVNITGGFNGDLYGYLRLNDSPLVVLVNRVGMTGLNPDGYADSGFSMTFTASLSAQDIHFYQNYSPSYNGSGQLTGLWQADGRANPLDSTRSSSLSDFDGLNPNGTWTLFFADRAAGDEATLVSWSLDLTSVPEPIEIALSIFAGLAVSMNLMRWLRKQRPVAA